MVSRMTPAAGSAVHEPRTRRGLLLVGVAVFMAWLGLLSWDNQKDVRGGVETGPWDPWQVISLIVIVSAVVVAALVLGQDPIGVILVSSGIITLCFVLSFTVLAPPTLDASLWPIAVTMIGVAAIAGCSLLAAVVLTARRWLS